MNYEVRCSAAHAFSVWVEKTSLWWPLSHTMTCELGLEVVFEPGLGGRILERTPDGREIQWGEITEWEPPNKLGYLWWIATDRANATDIAIRFVDQGATTRIEIEHVGWERLGSDFVSGWRDANQHGWMGVMPEFIAACNREAPMA
jgi:uncharacterized protein YndB with AHSA1/START domain